MTAPSTIQRVMTVVAAEKLAEIMAVYRSQSRPRAECEPHLTRTQIAVASLLSEGLNSDEIAARLECRRRTIDHHIYEAAARIPGDLMGCSKMKAWYRGATLEVLGAPPDTKLYGR